MPKNRLNLTRDFSIRTIISVIIILILLVVFYRQITMDSLISQETRNNSELTNNLSQDLWPEYAKFLSSASSIPRKDLLLHPNFKDLNHSIQQRLRGLRVLKIKIYDLQGVTVYSTLQEQIGDNRWDNAGFQSALSGVPLSDVSFKNEMDTIEGTVTNRHYVYTYAPIQRSPEDQVEGVFEVYSDVTHLHNEINRTGYVITGGVIFSLAAFYLFLLFLIKRADRLIHQHQETENQLQEERMLFQVRHDKLTGLSNRSHMLELVEQALHRSRRTDKALAVLQINLARFRPINETMGHEVGDQIIKKSAVRMVKSMRNGDILGRLEGDLFLQLMEGITDSKEVANRANRLLEDFQEPLLMNEKEFVMTPSIGIALFPSDAQKAETLLESSGAAALKATKEGRNCYVFYTDALNASSRERIELEMGLRKALQANEFELHYQPRISPMNKRVIGCEALIRWRRGEHELMFPDQFVKLLEESDLIIPVGTWVLGEACRQCYAWHKMGLKGLRVSVNLSLRQFKSNDLPDVIEQTLQKTGLAAQYLEVEVTESLMAEELERVIELLQRIKRLGVMISLDDFGTGYSSLSHLMNFPVDHLKIDRAFVQDVTHNSQHAALTSAIIAMARSLNMGVVVEGVEDSEQQKFLEQYACEEQQGYFYAKPLPAKDFPTAVEDIKRRLRS
ncbi:putative bifunctional diguanylate cyclase/phosphodiesterase [Magnetococcus sp. PR-3]|uniref:putative bifunctional diguanylate cyclase/phosphodiesterase n=1 Tax=Magnetococcus sp. PR-3 TaxID=3120355 RepID=UPI002FCDF506